MLTKAKELTGYKLQGIDGDIGEVREFLFDDTHWTIRYLVAETGTWLETRQVLISPHALVSVHADEKLIVTNLMKKQIEDSPALETNLPVSRQFEKDYHEYYEWPVYWGGPFMWGSYPTIVQRHDDTKEPTSEDLTGDPHLRSTDDVCGHDIEAQDGEIGVVVDFIVDETTWAIHYLVVATRTWWPGKQVLISPRWIERVSWYKSKVYLNLTREAIREAPEYNAEALIRREYEIELHRHYNRPGYWDEDPAGKEHAAL